MVGDYQKAVVDQEEGTRGIERRGGVWRGLGGESVTSTWEAKTGWARIVFRLLGQAGTQLGWRRPTSCCLKYQLLAVHSVRPE